MWPCITVLGNALGDMYIYGSLRAVENVKIIIKIALDIILRHKYTTFLRRHD